MMQTDQVQATETEQRLATKKGKVTILCPRLTRNNCVLDTVYALQYLPTAYSLVIGVGKDRDSALETHIHTLMDHDPTLKERISFRDEDSEGGNASPSGSLFSDADIVVYGTQEPAYTEAGIRSHSVIVFDIRPDQSTSEGEHNLTISEASPESLASAILKVAHQQM